MIADPSRRDLLAAAGAAVLAGCSSNRSNSAGSSSSAGGHSASSNSAGSSSAGGSHSASSRQPADGAPPPANPLLSRRIPSSGETVPAIGLGSWQTFDVPPDEVARVQPVLARFLQLGGTVVDSSPMYGEAESAIGAMLANLRADPATPVPFLATKVWTSGERDGEAQMRRSMQRLGVAALDLMQIHNLLDWKTHLRTLRAWKERGVFRHIGITHYQHGAFADLEHIVRTERIDFIQLPYSVSDRLAADRLLPAAADAGVAVLVMQPFDTGGLFDRVRGKPVPPIAAELGATSWAQLFLLWILGHPAVTCPIPATSKVSHLEDNLGALRCRVPDETQRAAIVRAVG